MEFLLKRRHLAPAHTCNQALADPKRDSLVIDKIPDIFATGHIHRVSVSSYRNVTLLNCSTWATETPYQEKVGLKPQPGRALLVNLQTRKVKIMKFYDEEKEKTQKQEDAVASDVQAAPSKGVV
jgi:DNA polymerase II small subunit